MFTASNYQRTDLIRLGAGSWGREGEKSMDGDVPEGSIGFGGWWAERTPAGH